MEKELEQLVEGVKEARAEFEARLGDLDAAKEKYYEALRRLHEHGMPLRDIADAVGVSHQRVHQIVGDRSTKGKVKRAVAKHARAGGAALLLLLAASWMASSGDPQRREDAVADLEGARSLMAREQPSDARALLIPALNEMIERAGR